MTKIQKKYNCSIPINANIHEFKTPHGLSGIFISSGAVIGKECVIFHQVTIGSNTLPDSKNRGAPVIGDNVYIGAGAKIIGNVVVGNGARIGANCVVVKSIPENATVVLPPPRIIEHQTAKDNSYIDWGGFKQQ